MIHNRLLIPYKCDTNNWLPGNRGSAYTERGDPVRHVRVRGVGNGATIRLFPGPNVLAASCRDVTSVTDDDLTKSWEHCQGLSAEGAGTAGLRGPGGYRHYPGSDRRVRFYPDAGG